MNAFGGFKEVSEISNATQENKLEISKEALSKFEKIMGTESLSEANAKMRQNDAPNSSSNSLDKFEKLFVSKAVATEGAETNKDAESKAADKTDMPQEPNSASPVESEGKAEDVHTDGLDSEADTRYNENNEQSEQQADNAENAPEHITCRNESLEGQEHPETGVPYEKKEVEVDGKTYEVVVPVFESALDAQLPEDMYEASDNQQFKECNEQLKESVANDKELREKFTDEQLEQIENGETPDGYTWHHDAETGKMQLVDTETHRETGHTGGRNIWGGGTENR